MLTSTQESEDSRSQPKQSATKPSRSRKSTRPQTSSSTTGGQKSTTLETLKPSDTPTNTIIGSSNALDALISLRLACHANLPAMLDSDWGVLTPAGNGLTPLEPCGSFDRGTQSLRTHQLSLLSKEGEPSTELCQNWSRSGMICGGTYFPLPRLVRVTCENDSSLSLPTPCAALNNNTPERHLEKKEGTSAGQKITDLNVWAKTLPTATCNDGRKRGNNAYWKDPRQTTFEDNLPRAIHRQLTLPTTTTTRQSGDLDSPRNQNGASLGQAVAELLPTARASAGENRTMQRTPIQSDDDRWHGKYLFTEIMEKARLLTTPNARDWKDTSGSARNDPDHHHGCDQLPRQIFAAESTEQIGGARLSPEFLCWFMGYPTNWLKPLVDAQGTPLFRRRSSRSSEQSTTGESID